jgi:probable F420-dependent oxidoreductase
MYDPIALLASAASVTKTLNIGSRVFAVDFRHPAILAKAAATLHLLSSGRFEFGIGAGWDPRDYNMTGIPLEPASKRVERLEEAIKIIKGMWTQERTSFSGKHYNVTKIQKAGELPEGEHPKIMIGGGGRKMMRLAAQYADIVGIIARWRGSFSNYLAHELTSEGIKRKIIRVKKLAKGFGRDPDDIEFQMTWLWTEITENPEPMIENLAKNLGFKTEDILANEYAAFGSSSDLRDKIQRLREETGMNYFVFSLRRDQFDEYAESIVQSLTS